MTTRSLMLGRLSLGEAVTVGVDDSAGDARRGVSGCTTIAGAAFFFERKRPMVLDVGEGLD